MRRVIVMCLFVSACGESLPAVPEGSVGVRGGSVVAPGATLLHAGQLSEERAAATGDDLVAIERDGAVYLYHPAVGDAVLSEETSRIAVGYFAAGLDSTGARSEALVVRPDGQTVRSDTGVELSLRAAGAPLSATNDSQRWVAITTDQVTRPYFLAPAGGDLPTNLVDAFLADVEAEGWSPETNENVRAGSSLAIHGAVFRAGPLLFFSDNLASARQSRSADPVVFESLNYLDLVYFVASGTESLLGLVPTDCADALTESTVRSLAHTIANALLDGEHDREALRALYTDQLKSTMNDWLSCALEAIAASSPVAALALEAFGTFLDIVAFANWIVQEGFLGTYNAAFGTTAYDEVDIDVPPSPVVVGTHPLPSPARDVEVLLSDAYVTTDAAVYALDVDPSGSVTELGHASLTSGRGVAVDGARVLTAATGLQLWSFATPAAPVVRSRVGFNTESFDAVVRGDYVFVAAGAYTYDTGTGVFAVTRIVDPTSLDGIEWTGGVELGGGAIQDVVLTSDGQYAVVVDEAGDLHVIDVRIPAGPAVAGSLPGEAGSVPQRGLAISGNTVFVGSDALRVVDVSVRTAPRLLFESTPDGVRGVDVEGSRLYLTGDSYLAILDVSTPASPELLASLPLDHTGNAVDAYSGYAFVAAVAGTAGELVVVDLDGAP
ncbi:MAG: hypothetical protein IT378_17020 [Sandaracinaceae bacterium]|nr:hypothetical protein [Sandaracinaceae bacterium]